MSFYVEKRVRSALNYYGGKTAICRRILQKAPLHDIYVEGFAGGLSVLLNKFRSDVEVACDIDEELVSFYHTLVDTPELVIEKVRGTEFGKETFFSALASKNRGDRVTQSVNFLIRKHMSFSGLGMSWVDGGKEGYKKNKAWETLPYDLGIVARRLSGVKIVLQSAFDVIPEYDSTKTFFYLDPTYYGSTRASTKVYNCEMTEMDHLRLLRMIKSLKGSVILSGYAVPLYDRELAGWDRVEIDVVSLTGLRKNDKGEERSRRTEILWVKPQ